MRTRTAAGSSGRGPLTPYCKDPDAVANHGYNQDDGGDDNSINNAALP